MGLIIDLNKLEHNAKTLLEFCNSKGISVAAVTKVFCADLKMTEVLCNLPFEFLADSRLENIESYPKSRKCRTMLLRLPRHSEALRVVQNCDVSLNSEISTLEKLAEAAKSAKVNHGIILMVDLGDLREGIYHNNEELIFKTAEFVRAQENLTLEGVGTNLACYGSVLPTHENLQKLCDFADKLEVKLISGGNSNTLDLLEKGGVPPKINNLRLGESIVCGFETAYGNPFTGLKQDIVTLEAEIIEIMEKPSMPEGELGMNAFGEKPVYIDKGIRKKALLAVGRQDTNYEGLGCLEQGIEIVGSSSDHLIVDITEAEREMKVGDGLVFSLSYGAILAGFTSKYINREYLGG